MPLAHLWYFLYFFMKESHVFSSMGFFLNHLSPIWGNLVSWDMKCYDKWIAKFPILVVSPLNVFCKLLSNLSIETYKFVGKTSHPNIWRVWRDSKFKFLVRSLSGSNITSIVVWIYIVSMVLQHRKNEIILQDLYISIWNYDTFIIILCPKKFNISAIWILNSKMKCVEFLLGLLQHKTQVLCKKMKNTNYLFPSWMPCFKNIDPLDGIILEISSLDLGNVLY